MTNGGVSGTFEQPTPPSLTLRIEGLPAYSFKTSICDRPILCDGLIGLIWNRSG